MESLNLSDTQNISINTQNKASNTAPSACAFCGSNDYMKTFSQANCFRTFYPGIPSSKPSESCEDNFTIHQPIFSSPPFLPSFHNSPVPQSVCFGHTSAVAPNLNHSLGEKPMDNGPSKTEKKSDGANTECEEKEKKTLVESGINFPQHFNPYFQGCFCNSSMPWTCNPFIVPIISYYVLWNSQRASLNSASLNCDTKVENETQNETQNDAVLSVNSTKPNCFGPSNLIFNGATIRLETNKEEDSKTEKEKVQSEENTLIKSELNKYPNAPETLTNDFQTSPENNLNQNEENVKIVETGANISSSVTDFESPIESEIITEKVFNFEDYGISSESKTIIQDGNLNANEEFESSSTESCGAIKERVPSIKLIKNFTMTDQSKNEYLEETSTSAPVSIAAGDLGGEHCVGYKVNILDLEKEKEESVRKQNEDKPKIKDSKPKKTRSSEPEAFKHLRMKTPPKVGVGKLCTSLPYSKTGKSENWTSLKKENSKKPAISRVKHNCLSQPCKKDFVLMNIKNSKCKNYKETVNSNRKYSECIAICVSQTNDYIKFLPLMIRNPNEEFSRQGFDTPLSFAKANLKE